MIELLTFALGANVSNLHLSITIAIVATGVGHRIITFVLGTNSSIPHLNITFAIVAREISYDVITFALGANVINPHLSVTIAIVANVTTRMAISICMDYITLCPTITFATIANVIGNELFTFALGANVNNRLSKHYSVSEN